MAAMAGVDFAYIHRGFTAQGEVTHVQSVRLRGDEMGTDSLRTRASVGLHLGYVVGWHIAVAGKLHYEETLTASVGLRMQFKLGEQTWIRPGIAYLKGFAERGLDAPMLTTQRGAVMLDVPVTF